MTDLAELLMRYGYGQQDPGPDETFDTSNVLGVTQKRAPNLLNRLAGAIPENTEHSVSLANMLKGGLDTAGRWLGGNPEVGRDTLAPLGLAGLAPSGMIRGAAHAAPHPSWGTWENAYHGTSGPLAKRIIGEGRFRPGPEQASFHAAEPALADEFATGQARTVIPTKINTDGFDRVDWPNAPRDKFSPPSADYDKAFMALLINDAERRGAPGVVIDNMKDEFAHLPPSRQYVVLDPSRIRSRYSAEFDPAKAGSANLLAADPFLASLPGVIVNAKDEPRR